MSGVPMPAFRPEPRDGAFPDDPTGKAFLSRSRTAVAGLPLAVRQRRDRERQQRQAERRRLDEERQLADAQRRRTAKLQTAPPVPDGDKQVRHRTGLDDHLELGRPARPAQQAVPVFPVTVRRQP